MDFEYGLIEEAFEFVSAGHLSSHRALLDTETGKVLFQAESGDLDEFPEIIDGARYKAVPTRAELHLGKALVISFTKSQAPDSLAGVYGMFCHRGAYAKFKEFLAANNLLDHWYEYERAHTEKALREWCGGTGISLSS